VSGNRAQKVLSYSLLPGVIPRARELFASGFGYIAFLLAYIYNAVRLLPRHHPYLVKENIGKYGLRHVIAEAANHLVLKKKNIDQLVVFVLSLCGVVLLVLQFVILLYSFIIQPAVAQGNQSAGNGITLASMFKTPDPTYDIALMMMDRVFGIPGMYGSCVARNMSCDPNENPNVYANATPGAAGAAARAIIAHQQAQTAVNFGSDKCLII